MACKIRIDPYNKEAGKRCYVLITQDAASLEARVATADTALNDDGIDPVLSKVYERGSEYGEDLHSVTSWNTFAKSVDLQINEVVDEDSGTTYLVLDEQDIVIKRNGVQGIVKGAGLQPNDSIVGYVEKIYPKEIPDLDDLSANARDEANKHSDENLAKAETYAL